MRLSRVPCRLNDISCGALVGLLSALRKELAHRWYPTFSFTSCSEQRPDYLRVFFLFFFFPLVDLIGRLAMFSSVTLSLLENQS